MSVIGTNASANDLHSKLPYTTLNQTMPSPTDAQMNAIADALRAGNKIEAVKLHREATGSGLKEAKDEIEAIEAGLRARYPDRFPAKPAAGKGGCLGLAAFGVATGLAGLGWWISHA
jgi:hypothetical protein